MKRSWGSSLDGQSFQAKTQVPRGLGALKPRARVLSSVRDPWPGDEALWDDVMGAPGPENPWGCNLGISEQGEGMPVGLSSVLPDNSLLPPEQRNPACAPSSNQLRAV